jgi:Helix-turn-helix domain
VTDLAVALLAALDDDALDALAERLAPRLAGRLAPTEDGWLDSKQAAAYLGVSVNALHKLTAARAIPFEQDGPGCKLYFRRCALDRHRQGGA